MLKRLFKLNQIGVLGINARNLSYIKAYNSKKAMNLADDKMRTKQFLSARDIPVPRLYNTIKKRSELERFDFNVLPDKFALKPNYGYGGEGIIIVVGRNDKGFITSSGKVLSVDFLRAHIEDIMDGRFSIANQRDMAFFEQLIECDETVAKFAYKGLPDIRIVVHNLIPIMAMLRLPTEASDGKANLHLGAVGVGIDISTGRATHIMHHNKIVDEVPGAGGIRDLIIPHFDEMLLIASKIQLVTNIGYLAVDLALDKNAGPMLLEVNARAGLAVQIANLAPLKRRLERIKGVKVLNPEKGVRVAQDMFGNKLDKEIKNISGKEVIGVDEPVALYLPDGGTAKTMAHISMSLESTVIDKKYAEMFQVDDDSIQGDIERVRIKFSLGNQRVQTLATVQDLSDKDYKLLIGRKDISNHFLVDPSRKKDEKKLPKMGGNKKINSSTQNNTDVINFVEVDKTINLIDSKIKLLYYLKPMNLAEEKNKFFADELYNPQFVYPDLKFDPYEARTDLKKIKVDDSDYGKLFLAKKDEILKKISLLEKRGTEAFTAASIDLFGYPDSHLVLMASKEFEETVKEHGKVVWPKLDEDSIGTLNADNVVKEFNNIFKEYKIEWKAKIKEDLVSRCIAGKKNSLFVRKGALFNEKRIKALIAHEVETHILSAENGKLQPYTIFNRGTANYLETQEGLAIYNTRTVSKDDPDFFNIVPHVIVMATSVARDGGFRDVYNYLRKLGFFEDKSFRIALKLKRGLEDTSQKGVFTKDFIYYKGYKEIVQYVENGGKIKDLYIGKVSVHDIDWIKKLRGIKQPKYLPKWLEE
ncbi:MAG: DUF1704 domain-containing protein [Candidatus Peregrinibacteria bacterium]|nr:DUF1704 domain-containing protein [Candidatus Peregrinibacteria bacterium]MDZ4244386.1 DUF1704 domain-containing protein [Candidatus Gracilibacteria bacterium]